MGQIYDFMISFSTFWLKFDIPGIKISMDGIVSFTVLMGLRMSDLDLTRAIMEPGRRPLGLIKIHVRDILFG